MHTLRARRRQTAPQLEELEPLVLPSTASGAAAFPLTNNGQVALFSDQLPTGLSSALVQFIASHFAGAQKLTKEQNALYLADNPNWLLLNYRLGTESGPAPYIHNDTWSSDWSTVTAHEDWFMHAPDGSRLSSPTWGWDLHDITNPGFQQYWINSVLADMQATGAVGVFADSFDAGDGGWWFSQSDPRFAGTNAANPAAWPNGLDWDMQLNNWMSTIEAAFQNAPNKPVLIPNAGNLTTGWVTENWSLADGAFLEGFGEWGGGYLKGLPSDWTLSMNRALQLSDAGKILIMEPTLQDTPDSATGQLEREFLLGTYFLLQGDHTYLNMMTNDSGSHAWYYPEYQLNLGAPVTPLASDVSQYLWNGVYRRDFQNGMVLVNPTDTTVTLTLPGTYQQVQGTGGGILGDTDLNAQGQYVGGQLTYTPVTQVTLVPGSAAILMNNTPTPTPPPAPQPPAPAQSLTAQAGNGQVNLSWTVPSGSGIAGVVVVRQTGQAPTSPTDGTQVYQGTQTQFTDTGVTNGQTYYYKVFTYSNASGTTLYSDPTVSPSATATPQAPQLPAPVQSLTAQAGNGQVMLSWTAPSDPTVAGVVVVRQTGQAPTSPTDGTQVYQVTQTQFTDTGLANGQTYFYKVFTYSTAGGTTLYSDPTVSPSATATPQAPQLPAPVQSLTAQAGNGQVTLSWTVPSGSGIAGVVVVRQTGQAPTSPTDGTQVYRGTQTQFTNTGLVNGRTYYYKVFTFSTTGGTTLYSDPSLTPSVTATPRKHRSSTTSAAVTPTVASTTLQIQTPPPVTSAAQSGSSSPPDLSWWESLLSQQGSHPRRKKHKASKHHAH
jgi:hypothetical protein